MFIDIHVLDLFWSLNFNLLAILNRVIITSTLCDALLPDDGVESCKPTWNYIRSTIQCLHYCAISVPNQTLQMMVVLHPSIIQSTYSSLCDIRLKTAL